MSKKLVKKISVFAVVVISIAAAAEVNDILNPSDSGDMMAINYYIKKAKAQRGDIESALHLAVYHNYNTELKKEYKILHELLTSKKSKTPSQWERILDLSLSACIYSKTISPSEIESGLQNAHAYGGLTERGVILMEKWKSGGFPSCLPPSS